MIYLIGFLITIGVLVTIHEWGHYIVARYCNVRVQVFSIGFGKILWQKADKNGTNWAISAIPLGGYVKMLDSRNEEVPPELYPFEFTRKKVWQKALIIAAGPVVNLIFAFILFVGLYSMGIKDVLPILGKPLTNSPAANAQIVGGEVVVRVNGKDVNSWQDIREKIIDAGINAGELSMEITEPLYSPNSQVGSVVDLVSTAHNKSLQKININTSGTLKYPPINLGLRPPLPLVPAKINRLIPNLPAASSELKVGDEIISVDEKKINNWEELTLAIQAKPSVRINLQFLRAGAHEPLNTSILTNSQEIGGKKIGVIGIEPDYEKIKLPEELIFRHSLPIHLAVFQALNKTWDSSVRMVRFIKGIFTGEVSWRFLNGPFTIAEFAGKTLSDGLNSFIQFVCAVSISLGIINLFPLPVLDGGHLVLLAYEAITKKPPAAVASEWLNRIGVTLILLMMITAIYNDIFRYFG